MMVTSCVLYAVEVEYEMTGTVVLANGAVGVLAAGIVGYSDVKMIVDLYVLVRVETVV